MSFIPKSKKEEKECIWIEECLKRADRTFEMGQAKYFVYDEGTLRKLIQEIIEDMMSFWPI